MKKLTLLMILTLLYVFKTSAQRTIDFRAGLDLIPTSSNDKIHTGDLPKGFHFGFLGQIPMFRNLTFNPEVQYNWLNYYSRTNVPENEFVGNIAQQYGIPSEQARQLITSYRQKTISTTSYLYLPLLFRFQYRPNIHLQFGPSFGILLRNKEENNLYADVEGQTIEDHSTIIGTYGIRNTNYVLSLGFDYKLSPSNRFEFRYGRSLNSLEDGHSTSNSYYNYLQFSVIQRVLKF